MPDPLLATKISLPILRHIFVPGKKVLRQLSEGIRDGRFLTLVSALAGYGKTTTIRMWVEEAGNPSVEVRSSVHSLYPRQIRNRLPQP